MAEKWTPGPWVANKNDHITAANGDDVALIGRWCEDDKNADANARLISAAPELYEALVLILPLAKGYAAANRVGSNARYIEAAEAILAKARGEDET